MHPLKLLGFSICLFVCPPALEADAAPFDAPALRATIDAIVQPVMATNNVPGMAVAITVDGKRFFYNYGVASKVTKNPIASDTLFEIGSISKIFTATLAGYAQAQGKLALTDSVSRHLPILRGSSFDQISLLNLGTYTAGGLPLQVPDNVANTDQLMAYLRTWKPARPTGESRTYSNPSIGLLGVIAAKSLQLSFDEAIEKRLFTAFGMENSFINVPANRLNHYAQGYSRSDAPVRVNPGVLAAETYGVKSSAADILQFLEASMSLVKVEAKWTEAIAYTQRGYFKTADMVQGLGWERYPYPLALKQLLGGNGEAMLFDANAVTTLAAPIPEKQGVLFNKTGSTNGFGAYVLFVPTQKFGIVILANKSYPIAARVTLAYEILDALGQSMR